MQYNLWKFVYLNERKKILFILYVGFLISNGKRYAIAVPCYTQEVIAVLR